MRLALQLYHYITYICTSFGEVLLSISWIRVPRPEPRRFRRAVALHRPLLWRRFLPLFQRFYRQLRLNHIHRTVLNFLWYMRPCTPIQSSQFNHIQSLFDTDFFFSLEKCIFSVTKLRHIVSCFHIFHVCFTPTFTVSSL